MKKIFAFLLLLILLLPGLAGAETMTRQNDGTGYRAVIEETNRTSLLPLLTEQVPGLFITQRGYAGYGVSGGAAGNISMRGMSGSSARMLILIDGHPNYAGIYGHRL